MTVVNTKSIVLGERDRDDLGDVAGLAKSISEIGLLHPIVISKDNALVAGGRRLAAVQSLGWVEVPVTVVDLTSASEALQAEADENTCRKPLTPYEASRARQRRIEILAPKAKENQGNAGKGTLSKLDKVRPVHVRKLGAVGSGYSGSTLDKVDRIRDAAERGVVRQGKTEVPAPAPVIDIAKRALEGVKKTGAAVDRGSKDFEGAVEAYIKTDPSVKRARLMKAFAGAQGRMSEVTTFDVAAIADAMTADDFEIFQTLLNGVDHWADRLEKAFNRPLRAVDGGSK